MQKKEEEGNIYLCVFSYLCTSIFVAPINMDGLYKRIPPKEYYTGNKIYCLLKISRLILEKIFVFHNCNFHFFRIQRTERIFLPSSKQWIYMGSEIISEELGSLDCFLLYFLGSSHRRFPGTDACSRYGKNEQSRLSWLGDRDSTCAFLILLFLPPQPRFHVCSEFSIDFRVPQGEASIQCGLTTSRSHSPCPAHLSTPELPLHGQEQQHPFMFCIMLENFISPSLTLYFLFSLSTPVPSSSSHAPQTGWQVTACYSLYFAAFNGCRCTHCCTAFPRSPRFLIILLKWFCACHHFHIKTICFNCTHRDVQIICCEQLIEFSSVCLQITPCLFEGVESCWVTGVIQDISGILG